MTVDERIIEQLRQCSVATVTHWLFGKGYQHVFMRGHFERACAAVRVSGEHEQPESRV